MIIIEDGYTSCGLGSHLLTNLSENKFNIKLSDVKFTIKKLWIRKIL